MAEPTKRQRRIRRLRQVCLSLLALILLALVLYPFWLAPLLPWLASAVGVRIGEARAQGYERILLQEIAWSNGATVIRIDSVDLDAPHRLLADWMMRPQANSAPQLIIEDWAVEVQPSHAPTADSASSASVVLEQLREALPSWQRWLRHARATNGELRLGDRLIPIPVVLWHSGQLTLEASQGVVEVDLRRLSDGSATLVASNANATLDLGLTQSGQAWSFSGNVLWLSNRFEFQGNFAGDGVLPASMIVESDTLTLNPETLGLSGFSPLQGYMRVHWTNAVYTFEGSMDGVSLDQGNWLPERIGIRLRGFGDLETLTVNRFALESPFVDAALEEPVTVAFRGRLLGERTRLRLQVDLGRIEALEAGGVLTGHIDFEPVVYAPMYATFQMSGNDLDGFGLRANRIEVGGALTWPNLQLTNVVAQLEPGTRCSAQLDLDLHDRRLNSLNWTIEGGLPGTSDVRLKVESVTGSGKAEGVWPVIHHDGHLELLSPRVTGFQADRVVLNWVAERFTAREIRLDASSGDVSLELTASGAFSKAEDALLADLHLEQLEIHSPEQTLQLAAPVDVAIARSEETLSLGISTFHLQGRDRNLTASAHILWPRQGYARLGLDQMDLSLVQPFSQVVVPQIAVEHLGFEAGWTNGPLSFYLETRARWDSPDHATWRVRTSAQSDGETIALGVTELESGGATVATLSGEWPLRLEPALGREGLRTSSQGFNRLSLDVRPGPRALDWLTQSTSVELEAPAVLAALTNDQGIVTAGLTARAEVISILQTNEAGGFVVPSIEDVSLVAVADLQGIHLARATASSLGQPVSATANYDISAAGWGDWLAALREPDWSRLSGSLSVRQAEIAALAKFAPGLVAPVGTMELELELNPNLQGRGSLRVSNAVTRPLNPVGALRDVQADIALEGWDATIRDLRATLLGRRVSLTGTVGWSPDGLRHMNVRVFGENLSLVHEPDMFIRADVNLHLLKAAEGTGRLSGEVKLRRSLLVRDFESFIELDRAEPEQRPPWFSITAEPFDSWGIDVRVNGDRFLNVITPAFKGEVSAGLQLLGTLGEPFLVGAVTVDSGKLLFPFGQVALERGRVDFSRQDPYRPQLDFRGEGLNFGYSITADLTGPMDSPNLTLQSVPPLTAQEILLMLSAGEIPRSDFGYTSSDKASRIGYFVGKEFVNRFIGNTAATERLVLRSGEYVTEDGGTTHMLEYNITGRLSVFGEYDRFQDFNSGLKVKVLSK